jgi:integrase
LKEVPRRLKDPRIFWWMGDRHTTLRRFQRRLTWAGLPQFRFHDLRHTFGAYAAQAGVNLEVIAAAMGHTSTTVTKLYAHLSPQYKRNGLMKMAMVNADGTTKAQGTHNIVKSGGS